MFTWTIESITNRRARGREGGLNTSALAAGRNNALANRMAGKEDVHQIAAEKSFQKLKSYFSDAKRVPYPLQGDVARMTNRRDDTPDAKSERLKGFAGTHLNEKKPNDNGNLVGPRKRGVADDNPGDAAAAADPGSNKKAQRTTALGHNTPAHARQKAALSRQMVPADDDETKMLRCPFLSVLFIFHLAYP